MALCLAILMFSLAGIPPLAGFFGKLFVFHAAIEAGLYALCVLGVLSSVVGAYYYLRIVKIMYLDPPADEKNDPMPRELSIVAGALAGICLLFFIYPSPLIDLATSASQALIDLRQSLGTQGRRQRHQRSLCMNLCSHACLKECSSHPRKRLRSTRPPAARCTEAGARIVLAHAAVQSATHVSRKSRTSQNSGSITDSWVSRMRRSR